MKSAQLYLREKSNGIYKEEGPVATMSSFKILKHFTDLLTGLIIAAQTFLLGSNGCELSFSVSVTASYYLTHVRVFSCSVRVRAYTFRWL